jgi:hypothetical protein
MEEYMTSFSSRNQSYAIPRPLNADAPNPNAQSSTVTAMPMGRHVAPLASAQDA